MFVDENNPKSRPTGEYSKVISKIAQDGVCPFCIENLEKYHKNPIQETKYWILTDNMYPYLPSKHHRLIIHKKHISHIAEIGEDAWKELQEIIKKETSDRGIVGGSFIFRFGETRFTGASVKHLHAHIVQSDPGDAKYDPLKGLVMRIG